MRKKRRKRSKHSIVQTHHITYNPEVVAAIFKGEHWLLTWMSRRKRISSGFLACLQIFIDEHKAIAEKLQVGEDYIKRNVKVVG
jgi:hypothetical protein